RLRWARKNEQDPKTPAHLAVAFDTFESRVVPDGNRQVRKSGSNQFHGSAFDFVRNTDFDANAYFNIQQGIPRNNLKRNQFGGTFGGPILKNRLFFFTAYQGQRQIETDVLPEQQTFTTAELGGDFSHAIPYLQTPVDSSGNPDGPECEVAAGCVDANVASFLQANPYFQPNPTL